MKGRYCLDANVFMAAWYKSYPQHIFSSLWEQLAECRRNIVLIKPIYDEIEPISSADRKLPIEKKQGKYPLRVWLEEHKFGATDINDETNALSLVLEREYEVKIESKGASQNDITLIAYAKIMDKTVVTFEGEQPQRPAKKYKYKIPLICREQGVPCIDFIGMLQDFNIII